MPDEWTLPNRIAVPGAVGKMNPCEFLDSTKAKEFNALQEWFQSNVLEAAAGGAFRASV